jgi:Zn-dependent M16 (insulinase) family peptidase
VQLTSQPIKTGDKALGRHQEVIKRQVSNVITKMSKEERSELKRKLESMEENPDSPEVKISVMPNLQTEIPSAAKDEHAPLEQPEEVPTGCFDEAMM